MDGDGPAAARAVRDRTGPADLREPAGAVYDGARVRYKQVVSAAGAVFDATTSISKEYARSRRRPSWRVTKEAAFVAMHIDILEACPRVQKQKAEQPPRWKEGRRPRQRDDGAIEGRCLALRPDAR